MFKETFRKVKLLGEGAFGAAYLVERRDDPKDKLVCKEVKISHLTQKERDGALEESRLLKIMSHPNIVAYSSSFIETNKLYIVMEFADGGDLACKVRDRKEDKKLFSERRIMLIFVQIAEALQYIHGRKILHRDLKPMNVFLTKDGIVKLGDFGIARVLESSTAGAQTTIGTPFYLSPEQCNNEPYGLKSDLWSLGVVTYELAALKVPFHAPSLPAVAMMIVSATHAPLPRDYSKGLVWIVDQLLAKEPADRPTLDRVLGVPFVQEYKRYLHSRWRELDPENRESLPTPEDGSFGQDQACREERDRQRAGRSEALPQAEPDRQPSVNQQAARQDFFWNRKLAEDTRRRAGGDHGPAPSPRAKEEPERRELARKNSFGDEEESSTRQRARLQEQRLASERAALERAHLEAAEDRRLAQQRRLDALQDNALRSQGQDDAHQDHFDDHRHPSQAQQSEAHELDEAESGSGQMASPDPEDNEQRHLQKLEQARREHAEETRRLQEKHAQARKGLVAQESAAEWLPLDEEKRGPDRNDEEEEQEEEGEEEQSTAAPTESDAPLSDVLVIDMRSPGARSRTTGGYPSGPTPSASSTASSRSARSSRTGGYPPTPANPTGSPQTAANRVLLYKREGLNNSAKAPERRALAESKDPMPNRSAARTPPRWRPDHWPDASSDSPAATSEASRRGDTPKQFERVAPGTAPSSAAGGRERKTRAHEYKSNVSEDYLMQRRMSDAKKPVVDARQQQMLQEHKMMKDKENEEKKQEWFRNRKSLAGNKRAGSSGDRSKRDDDAANTPSTREREESARRIRIQGDDADEGALADSSCFFSEVSRKEAGWYVIHEADRDPQYDEDGDDVDPHEANEICHVQSAPEIAAARAHSLKERCFSEPALGSRAVIASGGEDEDDGDGEDEDQDDPDNGGCEGRHAEVPSFTAEEGDARLGMQPDNWPPGLVHVRHVEPDSWADRMGIEPGSTIVAVNGNRTENMEMTEFRAMLRHRPVTFSIAMPGEMIAAQEQSEPIRRQSSSESRDANPLRHPSDKPPTSNPIPLGGRNSLVRRQSSKKLPRDTDGLTVSQRAQRARDFANELFSPSRANIESGDTPSSRSNKSRAASNGPSGCPALPHFEDDAQDIDDERIAYAAYLAAAKNRPKEMKDALQVVLAGIQVVNEDDCGGLPNELPQQHRCPVADILAAQEEMEEEESLAQENAPHEMEEADCMEEEDEEEEGEEEDSALEEEGSAVASSPATSHVWNPEDQDSDVLIEF